MDRRGEISERLFSSLLIAIVLAMACGWLAWGVRA